VLRWSSPPSSQRSARCKTETFEKGNVTPTFGVDDIDDAIPYLRERDALDARPDARRQGRARLRELESYAFVLLRRPADAPRLPERALDALQERHLAYLDRLAAAGKLLAAGPFSDQEDDSLRGLCVFAATVEEARALVVDDPSVRAGRLEAEVMTWSTPKGSVAFRPPGAA
jgi:uncharacterized protein YciI